MLRRGQDEIWADSLLGYWNAIATQGALIRSIVLYDDDFDSSDGVEAVRLVAGSQIVPGLIKIDGYSTISRMIRNNFEVVDIMQSGRTTNFLEFPYDWRRDVRWTAKRLAASVDSGLTIWRKYSGANSAKLILLAHSMGGLIAKYYLEVLGGWQKCRALITFGTPFQGSLNALNYLIHGRKMFFGDLSDLLRSCTSVYQLLPTYKAIQTSEGYLGLEDIKGVKNLDQPRAMAALTFQRELREAVSSNRKDQAYIDSAYVGLAVVGTSQRTLQSARLQDEILDVSRDCPLWISSLLADGDGTVPRYSAVVPDSEGYTGSMFVPERHSAIHNNIFVLNELRERIRQLQSQSGAPIRGIDEVSPTVQGLSLDLQDSYPSGEKIEIVARPTTSESGTSVLNALIESLDDRTMTKQVLMTRVDEDKWKLFLSDLPMGCYRISVTASGFADRLSPVTDIFQVT